MEAGKLQGVLTSLQSSYPHEERLLFSPSYFSTGPFLIIPLREPLKGWNELGKKIIAIPINSPLLSNFEEDSSIQNKIYNGILQALTDPADHRLMDLFIQPFLLITTWMPFMHQNWKLKLCPRPMMVFASLFKIMIKEKTARVVQSRTWCFIRKRNL